MPIQFLFRKMRLALLSALVTMAACDTTSTTRPTDPPPVPPAVVEVRFDTAPSTMIIGGATRLRAVPFSATGAALPDRGVAWSSSNVQVATVAGDGTVSAKAPGSVRIVATSELASASVALTVVPVPAARLLLDHSAVNRVEGNSVTIGAQLRDSSGALLDGRVVSWSSEDESIATVSPNGVVQAINEGTTTIVARHESLVQRVPVTVTAWFGGLLLFDVHEPLPSSRRLFRVDPRSVNEQPTSVFAIAGAWQAEASRATGRLVFTCTSDGPAICVADADGTNFRVLTESDRAYEDQPAWSPDGSQIAFRRHPQGSSPGIFNPTDIWIMNADGTNQRNLTADTRSQHTPTWSPKLADGSYRIAFVQDSSVRSFHLASLYSMRPDGSDRRVLTTPGEQLDEEPTWSPDGRHVVFTRTSHTAGGDLWVVDLTTGIERPFLAQELFGAQRHPAWSPDGRHLAFTSVHEPSDDQGYRAQIYTVRADGTFLKRRTSGAGEKEHTAWMSWPRATHCGSSPRTSCERAPPTDAPLCRWARSTPRTNVLAQAAR